MLDVLKLKQKNDELEKFLDEIEKMCKGNRLFGNDHDTLWKFQFIGQRDIGIKILQKFRPKSEEIPLHKRKNSTLFEGKESEV